MATVSTISIFVSYYSLTYPSVESSVFSFDVLACGACILFPRLAFFAVRNTIIVLLVLSLFPIDAHLRLATLTSSLRAMMWEFIFFIGIAAICFSGLLFALWTLGMFSLVLSYYLIYVMSHRPLPTGKDNWKLSSIAWLMVQIWFGNTFLSFQQAVSFHRTFGPILMTTFAALSNTLLLTSKRTLSFVVLDDINDGAQF
jgi:hypothetical protein